MKYLNYLWMGCMGLLLFACQKDDVSVTGGKTGFLVRLAEGVDDSGSRALPEELNIPVSEFFLEIKETQTGKGVYSGVVPSEEEVIEVRKGTYGLVAEYGDNPVLALDEPYFYGEVKEAEVIGGQTTPVTIACKVANSLLSVVYDNSKKSFEDVYRSYCVEVKAGGESVRIEDVAESAYFRAGSAFEVFFHGILKGDGTERVVKLESIPSVLQAGDHLKLTLSPETEKYDVPLSVVGADVESVTLEETVPMEWLPKPKVTAVGFDEGNTLLMYETETPDVRFDFSLSSALQELKFTLDFDDETYQALNGTYALSELTEETRNVLTDAGIVLPSVGAKEASLDFTGLVARLSGKEGEVLSNVIALDEVKANNRALEGEQTYTIQTHAPDFSLMVYPGNTWTKQFTATTEVAHGDADVIRKGMTYEYSMNGTAWTSSADSLIAGLAPGTAYQVRGKFKKYVTDVVDVRTYEAFMVPNSTFDEGYSMKYPKKDNPLYVFDGGWIGTRNELTCHDRGVNAFYVSKSSTLPVEENGSTVAYMTVIGWGEGNTCNFGNKSGSVIYNISSGIVCVGNYDASTDVISAREAYIRPTSLSFTYKASPYNGDEYLIEAVLLNVTDGVETVVGEARLQSGESVADYSSRTIDIVYNDLAKELSVSHVKILFKAGTMEDKDHLENKFRDASLWEGYTNAYLIGSQFWLDSFQLNYDK